MASDSESECDLGDEPSNFLDLIFGLPPSRDEFYDVAPSWCGEAQLCATPTDAWAEFLGGMPWHGWVRGRATLEGGRLRWFEAGRRQPVYEVEVEVGASASLAGATIPLVSRGHVVVCSGLRTSSRRGAAGGRRRRRRWTWRLAFDGAAAAEACREAVANAGAGKGCFEFAST